MHQFRAENRTSIAPRSAIAFLLAIAMLFALTPPSAFAATGTTGIISGTVTDAQSHVPIANVKVSASAATGSYSATTNSRGFYSITGVFSDTYTVSFQAKGYEPVSFPGVTVISDQTQTIDVSVTKSLRTIASVTSRSAGGAFQPNQTVDTYTVTASQAKQVLGNNINLSESQLISSLPGASLDSSGYPVIRGGRENEESFQFEGIPYTDAFTNQFVNTLSLPGLGLQSAQLTPGVSNAAYENQGTGTLNLVVKRGTYPGFANVQGAVGFPNFRHSFNGEFGFASPDGRISDYITFAGRNFAPVYHYPTLDIGRFYSLRMETDREFINNFVYRFGSNKSQSLQFFADLADHHFYDGLGANLNALPFASGDPYYLRYAQLYSGLFGAPMTRNEAAMLTPLDPYQTSTYETLGQANRAPISYYQPNNAFKLQYTNNLNNSTYLSLMAYKTNAVTTFDMPLNGVGPFNFSSVLQQGGATSGLKLDIQKQLNDQHLLKFGGAFAWLQPVYDQPWSKMGLWNTIFGNGEFLDFLSNTDPANPCPVAGACGYLQTQGVPYGTRVPAGYETSTTTRGDSTAYINDTITPNDRTHIDIGLRANKTAIHTTLPLGMNPATCEFYIQPSAYSTPGPAGPNAYGVPVGANIAYPGHCGTPTFNNTGKDYLNPTILQPVVAMSYKLGPHDSIRAAYGRSVEFPTLGLIDLYGGEQYYMGGFGKIPSYSSYNGGGPAFNCGLNADTVCLNYGEQLYWDNQNGLTGFGAAFQPAKPETFTNWDFSYSHEFTRGFLSGVQTKITPFLRRSRDALATASSPLIVGGQTVTDAFGNPVYGPPIVSNKGFNQTVGVEAEINRQVPVGFSPQFTATYLNEVSNVVPLSGSEDFYPSIPAASLALGNIYRVGFLSPFQSTLSLNYTTKNGWRVDPVFTYNVGYPIGAGLLGAAFVNGKAYTIPNTNYSAGLIGSPAGATQYIDPGNPGSVFSPNIAATRGTPESASPGGKLSHPNTNLDLTLEYTAHNGVTLGATVLNVFDEIYGGPGLNGRYQPVATGISGPKSGTNSTTYTYGPALGFANYSLVRSPYSPYLNTPSGAGRTFYVYMTTKI